MAQHIVSRQGSKALDVVVDRMEIRAIMNYTKGVEYVETERNNRKR